MSWPAYPAYKDSGIQGLGNVPAHWSVRRLKDAGTLIPGTGFPHDLQGKKGSAFQFYKVGDLSDCSDGRYMQAAPNTITLETVKRLGARPIPPGSILWPKIGAALLLNRRRICVSPCCIDNNLTAYVPRKEQLSTDWAYHWSTQLDFKQFANPGAVPSLGEGYQSVLPLLLPPTNEQEVITSFLDHETARIDALIEEQQHLIDLLQEKRQAVISHAVTKGLDPDVAMQDSGVEWLGKIPAHWNRMKFLRCVRIAEGQVDPTDPPMELLTLIAPNHIESGTGTVRSKQSAAEQGAESGKYLCYRGDVIYSKIRPSLRKACLADETCLCSADMYPLRPIYRVNNSFLLWIVLSDPFTHLAILESERVAMPKINRESLKEIWLPVPPLDEQERVCKHIDTRLQEMDNLINQAGTAVGLLREHRSALISAAVTGKIDVREWKPQDTPVAHELPQAAEAEAQYG